MSQDKEIKLNLGCGLIAPNGWVNIDASWNARLAKFPYLRRLLVKLRLLSKEAGAIPWPKNVKIHDVTKGLPYSNGSVSAIYSSYLLEHLARQEAAPLLKECYRVLKPGGVIRLVVPDLKSMTTTYLDSKRSAPPGDPTPAEKFIEDFGRFPSFSGSLLERLDAIFMNRQHKWWYDVDSLSSLLAKAGFVKIISRNYLESEMPNIGDIERRPKSGVMYLEGFNAFEP